MPENLFETMTAADFMAFLADIPIDRRSASAFWLLGWLMADLTDAQRGRAASELMNSTGAAILLGGPETLAAATSPLKR